MGYLQEVVGCTVQNCEKLCRTVRNFAKLCRLCGWWHGVGWQLVCRVGSGHTSPAPSPVSRRRNFHPAQPSQPSHPSQPSQPTPASGVWRNGVTQARPRAAPNLGWTGHPAPAPLKVTGDPGHHLIHHQQQQPADTRLATRFPGHRKTPPPRTRQHSTAQVTEFAQQTCKKYFMMSCLKSTQYSEKALQYYKCAFSFLQLKQSKISSLVLRICVNQMGCL